MFKEFKAFALRGNVVDLAVGVVIGAAFTTIVTSLVSDVIMPPIGLLVGGLDFSNFFFTLKGDSAPTLEAAKTAGAVTLNYGLFITHCIKFLIIAFAIFVIVKQINRLKKEEARHPRAAAGFRKCCCAKSATRWSPKNNQTPAGFHPYARGMN